MISRDAFQAMLRMSAEALRQLLNLGIGLPPVPTRTLKGHLVKGLLEALGCRQLESLVELAVAVGARS